MLVYMSCNTTDYASAAATALGITPAELRKDIVSGQSLEDIAKTKKVDLQTVTTALQTAGNVSIDQAVKDGILTQEEATLLKSGNSVGPDGPMEKGDGPIGPGPQGNQGNMQPLPIGPGPQDIPGSGQHREVHIEGPGGPQGNLLPDINNLHFLLQSPASNVPATPDTSGPQGNRPFGPQQIAFQNANFDVVNPHVVAAQALNMKCSDLVKTLVTTQGKTIAAVATDHKVNTKTVTDALTKAYKNALAQDVTDGIITQVQSDKVSTNLDKAVSDFVNNAIVLMGPPVIQGH
jgi:hypothetical protein